MKSKKQIAEITRILRKELELDEETAHFIASKIYADVLAPAVDDEREAWITTLHRDPRFDI